jgi:hypothetical protein
MGRMMRNFIESDKAKELFKQVPPGTVEAIGQSNTPLGNLLKGSGVAYPQQQTQTYAPLVQLQQSLPPLQFDNPERAERIESSLGRAAFGPERIREILMQLKEANFLANGGRVGYIKGGGLATTQDYATALSKVGAGTQEQKRRSVSDYAQNEAYGLLSKAASTPGGLTDLYNNYIKGTAVNSRAFDFGRDASTMNTVTAMNPQYKQNIIDQIAYTMQQNTPYRKTYPFENASMQELMPAGTVGSKNFESNITTPQEAAALARYIALQRGVDMQQYDAEQAATNAGTLDDFYRNLGLQTPTLRTGIPFAMGGPVSMTKNGVTTLFSMKR